MTKLSIIVPIYNVAPYLRKCVDGLLAQDLPSPEYEIILVDDESPDACPQICDEYARMSQESRVKSQELPCIRVIHRKNGGLSAARNSGIEVAKGEYIMFVDSDDYIEPNVLGGLLAQMERDNLEVLRYNYQNVRLVESQEPRAKSQELRVESKYEGFEPHKNAKPYFDYSSEVVDGETFLNERLGYACYAWAFLIKRAMFYKDLGFKIFDLRFTEGIYFEDTDWTPRMLMKAKRVASTATIVYNYLWREGSITLPDNPIKKKKVLEDKIKLLYGFKEHQKLAQNKQWFIWQTAGTTMSVLGILATYPSAERKPYIKQLKELDVYPLSTFRSNRNGRIKIMLANISPSLYCSLMSLIH